MKNFIATSLFILLSAISIQSQWQPVGQSSGLGGDIYALLELNNILYAGGTAYLFRSPDGGQSWNGYFQQLAYAWSLTKQNGNVYCGLAFSSQTPGIYKSTDNGISWNITSLANKVIWSLAANDSLLVAAADKIYLSTDDGQNWNPIGNFTGYLAISGSRIYSVLSGLRVTSDKGLNWNIINNNAGIAVFAEDSLILFGTQDGQILRSTDFGQSWNQSFNLQGAYVRCIYKYNQFVFAGTDSGFYVSANNGESFFSKNDNLGATRVTSIMIYNNDIYVANGNYGGIDVAVWKRPLSEVLDIDDASNEIPDSYFLYQNYPNPFNPSTTISWQSPVGSHQTLKIYDMLGNEVATLVDEYREAGRYKVEFNVAQVSRPELSSGIYLYKLTVGNFSAIRKMMLIK